MLNFLTKNQTVIAYWLVLAGLLLSFEILVKTHSVSPAIFASPLEIIGGILRLFSEKNFAIDLLDTAKRALLGLLIGYPLGALIAVAIYSLGKARSSAEFTLDVVRSIPITALIPLFIAVYGLSEKNKIAIGAFSALLVTAITVLVGIKQSAGRYKHLLALYRPNWWKRLFLIILPGAFPNIVAALRLAVSSSLVLVVVAEMFLGTRSGIGKVINDTTYGDDRPAQYAAIVCAGVLGFALNILCKWIERALLRKFGAGIPIDEDTEF